MITDAAGVAIRKTISPPRRDEAGRMSTEELRENFLISDLFVPGEVSLIYTDMDRMIVGGIVPETALRLPSCRELGTEYFTERREIGLINLGEPGAVDVGGARYRLDRLDCLYIGAGEPEIEFDALGPGLPRFYLLSCPAHWSHPTRKITPADVEPIELGDEANAARRRILQYITPGRVSTCQLTMGVTELGANSVWNTMPAHTHSRRTEVYLYFDLAEGIVVHLMGHPRQTRHLIVRDSEAVLSPWWSIHAGAGTRNYRFVWGMAGENHDFTDIDPVPVTDLR